MISCSLASAAEAQPSGTDRLPILLIHGYAQDQSVWDTWERWLGRDNFSNIFPIKFRNDDRCGSVQQHAEEVGVESAEPRNRNYIPLGEEVPFNHLDLLSQRDVYEMALPVLGS